MGFTLEKTTFQSEVGVLQNVQFCPRNGFCMHSSVIDQIRTRVWLEEIRGLTGESATHAIAYRLDPESMWIEPSGVSHQSKWYRYEKGTTVPSVSLANKVRSSLPGLRFDLHHPAWTLLRKPATSQKTIDRLIKRMPPKWRQTLIKLNEDEFLYRRINIDLVTRYHLTEFKYLDALLLFELGRREAHFKKYTNFENLTFIVLALPLLYINDPLWALQDTSGKKQTIRAIAHSLRLSGSHFSAICFPADRLAQAIAMQDTLQKRHTERYPRALNSNERTIKFLARSLDDHADDIYATATSAFVKECRQTLALSIQFFGVDPYGQFLWQKAWHEIKTNPKYSHLSHCITKIY